MTNDIQPIAMEFDGMRAITVTFLDPQLDSPAVSEISVYQIAPELYADEIAEVVDDIRQLIAKVQLAKRNPPAVIRRS